MKTIIIYYSASGHTDMVAKTISKKLDTDIIRIKDLKNRTGIKNRLISSIDAFREIKTKIQPLRVDIEDYDMVYFGTPTWAGNPSPAILTIIDRCDLRTKDVVLFATMSNKGGSSAIKRMREKVEARGARVVEEFTLKTKDKTPTQLQKDSEAIAELLDLNIYK
jgi:flavodoxin